MHVGEDDPISEDAASRPDDARPPVSDAGRTPADHISDEQSHDDDHPLNAAGDTRFADVLLDLRRTHVARVATAIRKLQDESLAAPDLDPHTAAAALCGMVEGFAAHWLGRGEVHDEAVATRTLTQLWVRGLGMPARLAAASGQLQSARPAPRSASPGAAKPAIRSVTPAKEPR